MSHDISSCLSVLPLAVCVPSHNTFHAYIPVPVTPRDLFDGVSVVALVASQMVGYLSSVSSRVRLCSVLHRTHPCSFDRILIFRFC